MLIHLKMEYYWCINALSSPVTAPADTFHSMHIHSTCSSQVTGTELRQGWLLLLIRSKIARKMAAWPLMSGLMLNTFNRWNHSYILGPRPYTTEHCFIKNYYTTVKAISSHLLSLNTNLSDFAYNIETFNRFNYLLLFHNIVDILSTTTRWN